jgi:hypothetical protein
MAKSINLTGTAGKTYNLDDLQKDTRKGEGELLVQIWKWNPNLPKENPHSQPNPPDLKLGQIWLSKLVDVSSDDFKELAKIIVER